MIEPPGTPLPPPAPLPPYPPPLPPPPEGTPWQGMTPPPAPWLPSALARAPLTAQFVVAATVQFVAAGIAFLVTAVVLLAGLGAVAVGTETFFGLASVGIPLVLCTVHIACGALALGQRRWAVWAGYALLVGEVFVAAAVLI